MPHAPQKPSMPLLFALCLFLSLLLAAAPRLLHAAEAAQKTVRVGYYEQTVFQEGGRPGAIRRGYAYEYYRKIAEYTGWRYEYVYGSFGELYEKFMRGEVDLLAGLAWKKERADIIGYPAASMGRTSYNLLKHASDRSITDSPASLSGKKLGVLESALAGALNRYMARKVVLAEIVSYREHCTISLVRERVLFYWFLRPFFDLFKQCWPFFRPFSSLFPFYGHTTPGTATITT